MTATRTVTIHCDGRDCLQWTGGHEHHAGYARRSARNEGWKRTGDGRDLCPACQRNASTPASTEES